LPKRGHEVSNAVLRGNCFPNNYYSTTELSVYQGMILQA